MQMIKSDPKVGVMSEDLHSYHNIIKIFCIFSWNILVDLEERKRKIKTIMKQESRSHIKKQSQQEYDKMYDTLDDPATTNSTNSTDQEQQYEQYVGKTVEEVRLLNAVYSAEEDIEYNKKLSAGADRALIIAGMKGQAFHKSLKELEERLSNAKKKYNEYTLREVSKHDAAVKQKVKRLKQTRSNSRGYARNMWGGLAPQMFGGNKKLSHKDVQLTDKQRKTLGIHPDVYHYEQNGPHSQRKDIWKFL